MLPDDDVHACELARRSGLGAVRLASSAAPCSDSQSPLRAALDSFPPVAHAFAYGSGVFAQPGAEALRVGGEPPMVDLIFAVDDPVAWHAANLERNAGHYSWLASTLAGPRGLVAVANTVGAGVHFNPFVRLNATMTVKYGVIDTKRLVRDLLTWEALYVAGRMHKPVATLATDERVATAADANLRAALAAALLLLPSRFSEAQLHSTLCGLSYNGDVRMGLAEDSSKVNRIAIGSASHLRKLYAGAMARASAWRASLSPSTAPAADGPSFVQNSDLVARRELIAALPPGVLHRMAHVLRGTGSRAPLALSSPSPHVELPGFSAPADASRAGASGGAAASSNSAVTGALVDVLAQAPQPQALLRRALAATVRASSGRQAIAGLVTAGLGTAARYVGNKMSKALLSRTTARALPPLA